ncbi:hypothetical protein FB45DRAFT_391875 [Roridomyces roridus]|uniref:Uncharacterized protein n=1 Tax=Roridomyces roridus TaxID=1738132 RepID=A0AAD7B2L4_9AGAR|nr:hypothetical protein FB45DRAFT_391875 [Roridomyces roridus]
MGTPPLVWQGDDSFKPEERFLPNLEQYKGTNLFMRRLETRSLRAVRFPPWVRITTSDVQTLKTLTNHAVPLVLSLELSIEELGNVGETTLSPLSEALPHIHSLELQTSKADGRAFRRLAYLTLTARHDRIVRAEKVKDIFRVWAAASSTLKGCCIGEMAWRKVSKTWEQCSREEFDEQAGFSVFHDV